MSRKTVSAVIGSLLVAGFALGAVQGCGSSSSSNGTNIMSACMQGCMKIVPCLADAGISETVAQCVQSCSASSSKDGGTCANESAIVIGRAGVRRQDHLCRVGDLRRHHSGLRDQRLGHRWNKGDGRDQRGDGRDQRGDGRDQRRDGRDQRRDGRDQRGDGRDRRHRFVRDLRQGPDLLHRHRRRRRLHRRERGGLHLDAGGKSGDDHFRLSDPLERRRGALRRLQVGFLVHVAGASGRAPATASLSAAGRELSGQKAPSVSAWGRDVRSACRAWRGSGTTSRSGIRRRQPLAG